MYILEFLRAVIRKVMMETAETRTRRAYLQQPDSETEADDWSNADEWKL
jgi:hypothetical protein